MEANGATPPEGPVVAVAQIKTANLCRTLTLTAEFKPYQEVDVMAKVAGYIKQINVDIGDRVTQGQLSPRWKSPKWMTIFAAPMPPSNAAKPT